MLTSCPECRTTFRVGQEQLDAKRGLVRCGHCNAVFNAYDSLLPELSAPPVESGQVADSPAAGTSMLDAPNAERQEPRLALDFDIASFAPKLGSEPSIPTPDIPAPAVPVQPEPEPKIPVGLKAYQAEAEPVELPPWLEQATQELESPDSILLSELPVQEKIGWAGFTRGLLASLLFLLMLLQGVFFLRGPLAAWQPMLRPYLEAACIPLACTVPLPRDRDALRVESSSLETDPESPSSARLRVAFSNRADQAMAWPHVVLTLTDIRDKTLAQRVFLPRDYLPARLMNTQGIKAGQEYEVELDMDLGNLTAAGYRVALEYP